LRQRAIWRRLGTKSQVRTEIAEVWTEIAALRSELKTEIAQQRSELRTEIAAVRTEMAEIKAELLKWIIGAVGFQTVVILAPLFPL
jgi:septal ring factor EnvC (AmiA/AmiB activator)